MFKTLHLFRHGLTDWNDQGRLQGHTDIPLNAEGRRQALALKDYFLQNPVDRFVSSDLLRAQQTVEIANVESKPVTLTPLLRESTMGDLEGLTKDQAHHKYGKESWEQWTSVKAEHQDFSFPGAECSRKTVSRMADVLGNFCRDFEFTHAGVSTHGLVIRRFLHHLAPHIPEPLPVANCAVYKIQWHRDTELFHFTCHTARSSG